MPQSKSPKPRKAGGKITTICEPNSPVVRLSDKAVRESLRRTQEAIKSGMQGVAPDGIPWPPRPRIRRRGNLSRIEIRRAVLTAMAASSGINLADLEKSLTEKSLTEKSLTEKSLTEKPCRKATKS